ncbi:MAG TPA: ABC transporter substrate-binding protein [Acetobacteraceae bacterium]|nr:ABC transporter substrate-binding protein [Acetobacteraceae bacterium]
MPRKGFGINLRGKKSGAKRLGVACRSGGKEGMGTTLTLSLACTQTDRSAPILDGRIPIAGCTIVPLPGQTQDIFRRVLTDKAFDVAEMSMSTHIVQVARNVEDYVAVPVFLSRAFRHSAIYIRTDRGIAKPEDLAGKTIGLEQYQQTVALWVRGILADRHGVRTEDVEWRNGGLEQPGGGERLALTLPPGIRLSAIPPGETLDGMLAAGTLDAVIATRPPPSFLAGRPNVGRLFPDYRQAELAYFRETRAFPIMHLLVIRRLLAERHPWLPVEVFRAFVRAKAHAMRELQLTNIARVTLPWIAEHEAETRAAMGANFWPYGLPESRHEIAAMLRYSFNDGLIARQLAPEELFHPSTHALADRA